MASRSSRRCERAYRRGDALAKRCELMDAWADWLEGNETAKAVSISSRQKRQYALRVADRLTALRGPSALQRRHPGGDRDRAAAQTRGD
jgi:hypothetical protein